MIKRLRDGEKKIVKASRDWSMFRHSQFVVEAHRIDSETPCVTIMTGGSLVMTDVETLDLIDRLQRALSMLPSSK